MRWKSENTIRQDFLRRSFAYLTEYGLETMSLRDLCKKTGISTGSIYYWFEDKEKLVIEASEFGLDEIAKQLFEKVNASIGDIDRLFAEMPAVIDSFCGELRFVQQVATSPLYGERMRLKSEKLVEQYDAYAAQLAEKSGGNAEEMKTLVYDFAAAASEYVVWGDKKRLDILLGDIRRRLAAVCGK